MAEFLSQTDIGNRAAQHCGARMMDPIQGFAEVSKTAAAIKFVYGKLRRAELQRNNWKFSIRTAALRPIKNNTTDNTDTLLLVPTLWVGSTTYFVGSIVSDGNGTLWMSNIPNNLNNQPAVSSFWDEYFGPMTVSAWDATTAYMSGELVYTAAGDGTNRIYLSLINGNADNPATATAWSATTRFYQNQVVTFNSIAYMSLIDLNLNNEPDLTAANAWSAVTTYAIGQKVYGPLDGLTYTSIKNGNLNNNPSTDGGVNWSTSGVLCPWTTVFVGGKGSVNWLQIGGAEFPMGATLSPINIRYPIGVGPSQQTTTRNIFRLPAGFLRKAPQDPKSGSQSWLGSPTGGEYDDWNIEGKYITSMLSDSIMLRFTADTVDVTTFDDMFCEGLAARIGLEVCEPLTQSTAKKSSILAEYLRFMGEARSVNAIETGSVEPPIDDYISSRF